MAKAQGSLRPDLQRMHIKLNDAPDRTVIIDKHGDAWQKSGYLGYWYRAFGADGMDAFMLAQNLEGATFIHEPDPEVKPTSTSTHEGDPES